MVPIKTANGTTYVKVKKQVDPYQNVSASSSSDKYDPTNLDFSKSSPLANKQFSPASASASTSDSFVDRDHGTFITKPYTGDASSQADHALPNLNTEVSTPATRAYDQSASGTQKSFITPTPDVGQNKTAILASSSAANEQDRTAALEAGKTETYTSPLASKQYLGPGAQNVPDDVTIKNNVVLANITHKPIVLSRMSNLPNRPLTVDEVRDLINHETKPNLDEEPEPPSKPLNDPDYKPEPSPAPPSTDDDKNDPVPSPGTIATPQPPENLEPLPQR